MYQKLDLNNWKRRATFDYFKDFANPFFNICSYLDVSQLYRLCKQKGYSFNLAILHYSLINANKVEEFRIRFVGEDVVVYDQINCGSTVLHEDETFSFCYFELKESVEAFVTEGRERVAKQLASKAFDPRNNDLNMIHYSVIPWTSFSAFEHAQKGIKGDSIPKIVFGRYFEEGGKMKLPISVAVNHAFVDGFHLGKYLTLLQEDLNGIAV